MRRRLLPLLAVAVLLCAAGHASAAGEIQAVTPGLAAALHAFRAGDFVSAVRLGRAAGTAGGSALAAWAELAQGEFLETGVDQSAEFDLAERDARRALAIDPNDPDGHIALAIVLGFIGRREGGIAAHFDGLADEARRHIDRALALAPKNAWAHGLLGGWNLEIVHDGGGLGGTLYGATTKAGIAAYERALALDPGNISIAYEFALDLAQLGDAYTARAEHLLSGLARRRPADAIDRLVLNRAQELAAAIRSPDPGALDRFLDRQTGDE